MRVILLNKYFCRCKYDLNYIFFSESEKIDEERGVIMSRDDTVKILKECNAGVKMGVDSIAEVLDNVENNEYRKILEKNKEDHQKIGSEIHKLLNNYDEEGKEPNPMAKGMSWIKTNVMLTVNPDDHTVADLITDGCNMGVKSLNRYLNKYDQADEQSKKLANNLIQLEHQLALDSRKFL